MTKQTEIVLAYLDGVLAVRDETSKEVATVLSALRGPDQGELNALKFSTTTLIRRVAFPRTARTPGAPTIVRWDFSTDALGITALTQQRLNATTSFAHFRSHILDAAQVLGIPVQK